MEKNRLQFFFSDWKTFHKIYEKLPSEKILFLGGHEMLDIKFVRENPDIVKENIRKNAKLKEWLE